MSDLKVRIRSRRAGAVMLLTGIMFLLIGGLGQVVFATHVQPVFLAGSSNEGKTCADNFSGTTESKLEGGSLSNGTHTVNGLTVTISNLTEDSFDFSNANPTVDGVIVKGGSQGSNKYDYTPGEEDADTGLAVPNPSNNAISHISFCWDSAPGTTTTTTTTTSTTTTTVPTTTTTVPTTTTTVPTTTTTVPTTTSTTPTTLAAQVLGVKITKEPETKVLGVKVLPKTGGEFSSLLFLAGICLTLGGLILVFGQRQYQPRHLSRR